MSLFAKMRKQLKALRCLFTSTLHPVQNKHLLPKLDSVSVCRELLKSTAPLCRHSKPPGPVCVSCSRCGSRVALRDLQRGLPTPPALRFCHQRLCGNGAAMENPEVSWPPQGLSEPGDSPRGSPVPARGSPALPDPLMHEAVSTSPIAGRFTKALPHSQPQPTTLHSSYHARFLLLQSTAKIKQPSKHRHSYFSYVGGLGRHADYWQRAAILPRRRPRRGREGHGPSSALTQNGRGRVRPSLRRDQRGGRGGGPGSL